MQLRNTRERYGAVAQFLHWGMFAFIALQLIGGEVMGELPKRSAIRGFAYDAHETLGLVLLALLALRICWKIANPAPPVRGPTWQRVAAGAVHVLLYALLIAIPVAGYVMVCAKGHAPAFFLWDLPGLVGKDDALGESAKAIHETLASVLVVVVAFHVAAALWHHLVARDAVLRRMLPGRHGNGDLGFRH